MPCVKYTLCTVPCSFVTNGGVPGHRSFAPSVSCNSIQNFMMPHHSFIEARHGPTAASQNVHLSLKRKRHVSQASSDARLPAFKPVAGRSDATNKFDMIHVCMRNFFAVTHFEPLAFQPHHFNHFNNKKGPRRAHASSSLPTLPISVRSFRLTNRTNKHPKTKTRKYSSTTPTTLRLFPSFANPKLQ